MALLLSGTFISSSMSKMASYLPANKTGEGFLAVFFFILAQSAIVNFSTSEEIHTVDDGLGSEMLE